MKRILAIAALFLYAAYPNIGKADDIFFQNAKVTRIEPSYMPDFVQFLIDKSTSPCAGTWFVWNAKGSDSVGKSTSVMSVYSLLLTAYSTNTTVSFWANSVGDGVHCNVTLISAP